MARTLVARSPEFEAGFAALLAGARATTGRLEAEVATIIAEVRARGDRALVSFTERFDHVRLAPAAFRVAPAELRAAAARVAERETLALRLAASRIEAFHRRQMPADFAFTDAAGVRMGLRWRPLDAVGVYVPGGKAAYPSSVLMNVIPARIAGVARIAMATPIAGDIPPLVAAAAELAGVSEVYRVGGAQAIAALAYGTETIRAVDCIVGPGNAYVAEAKRQVFGAVGIDGIAGPSEVVILADRANDPRLVAIDLLAQAEHDEAARAILITDDASFAAAVETAVEAALGNLSRRAIAAQSWATHGALVVVATWDEAAALVDRIAPEHLELMLAEPDRVFAKIHHAGAAFLGRAAPEALGDYVAGPNHVLPTGGSARFASGLSVFEFLQRTTFVAANRTALERVGPAAIALAEAEGLGAHAASIRERLARDARA